MLLDSFPEPVMIDFDNKQWYHPNIDNLLIWQTNSMNPGTWSYGHLYRVNLTNLVGDIVAVILYWPEAEWKDVSKQDLDNLIPVILFEDVWTPGDQQFCFTEVGLALSKKFLDSRITFVSPDVGIQKLDDGYSWST